MADRSTSTRFGVVDVATATRGTGLEFLTQMQSGVHPAAPFAEVIGMRLVEASAGRVVFDADPSARFYNPLGTVHGGWLASLLDSAMGCAVHSMLQAGQGFTTVEMKVNYVRPVLEQTGTVRCAGSVIHFGGRIATSEGRIVDGAGKLIAHGVETCMIVDVARVNVAVNTPREAL